MPLLCFLGFAAVLLFTPFASDADRKIASPAASPEESRVLFDGKTLRNWKATSFGGEGFVRVKNGTLMIHAGDPLTGVTWDGGDLPRVDYEISLEAMRVEGHDFFCGLTFPVGGAPCSLIVGGWNGPVVGLSNLDDKDASENETSRSMKFESHRWYRIRLRVTTKKIEAWIDDEKVVDVVTVGRKISIRPEVDASRPLGIATYRTTAAIRHLRVGYAYSGVDEVPARNSRVEAHVGSVQKLVEANTTISPTTTRTIPKAFKLTPAQVGPFAPTAPKL